jgi:hypothetical protein
VLLRSGPLRFGALLALALGVELGWALTKGGESGVFASGAVVSVAAIGRSLFTDYAFAFEVTSVLILVAMVGAVVLARRERITPELMTPDLESAARVASHWGSNAAGEAKERP